MRAIATTLMKRSGLRSMLSQVERSVRLRVFSGTSVAENEIGPELSRTLAPRTGPSHLGPDRRTPDRTVAPRTGPSHRRTLAPSHRKWTYVARTGPSHRRTLAPSHRNLDLRGSQPPQRILHVWIAPRHLQQRASLSVGKRRDVGASRDEALRNGRVVRVSGMAIH